MAIIKFTVQDEKFTRALDAFYERYAGTGDKHDFLEKFLKDFFLSEARQHRLEKARQAVVIED